jgi:hemerythrin-like domain-containing protein
MLGRRMTGETRLLSRNFSSKEQFEQGPGDSVLTSDDIILGFRRKLNLWRNHVMRGKLEIFPELLGLESEEGYQQVSSLVENLLEELRNKIKHYFPSLSTEVYNWMRNSNLSAQPENN